MELRETIQSDLDYMADHSMSRGVQKNHPERTSYTYTLEDKGAPLGIGGFQIINHFTAWCWVDIGPLGHDNMRQSYRAIREGIEKFAEEHKLKRLQAYVECDFRHAINMVKHLGFTKESTMKNFVGDRDAFIFVRIF